MDGPGRLAEYAWKRRTELGLSRPQVRDRGGPSVPTLKEVEEATGRTASAGTLGKLDVGLGWEPGSAADVLKGGEPRKRSAPHADVVLGPDTVAVSVRVVLDLLAISGELETLSGERGDDPGLAYVSRRLAVALRPLYGDYVTRLFEENKRRNGSLSPVFAMFSRLLDEPSESREAAEQEERLYRRWLAGRDVHLEDVMQERFQARFERGGSE